MIGVPKHLNTAADYRYVKNNMPENVWRPEWQSLLDTRFNWFNDGELADGYAGIEDDTHRVLEEQNESGATTRLQQVYQIDPNCKMLRLGLSVEDINVALNGA